jgi:hypothetical protein
MKFAALAIWLAFAVAVQSCGGGSADSGSSRNVVFHVRVPGDISGVEDYRVAAATSEQIAQMRAQIALPGDAPSRFRWIIGRPDHSNGGFNLTWNWHFPPDQWTLGGEATIEACQTSPVLLSQDVDHFINSSLPTCLPAEVMYEVVP